MKRISTVVCILSTLGLSDIQAQHEKQIWENDPTYSVNNYKHPNKAAAAKANSSGVVINLQNESKPASDHHTSRVIIPARKIVATNKTKNGKVKTPLAIRRKASEKLPDYVLEPETDQQLIDD